MNSAQELKNTPVIVEDIRLLKRKSEETTIDECEKLWPMMRQVLDERQESLAVAAIQIDYPLRASLIRWDDQEVKVVNPTIVEKSDYMVKVNGERCLSFPGESVNTARHSWVVVKDDVNGQKKYEGMMSVILQHEIDHMDGLTIFDRKLPEPFRNENKKIGRNAPCPCGSGKKYKKCCLK